MRKIIVNSAHVYSFGFGASLMILDTVYNGVDDRVKIAYVVGDTIVGNITTKKLYYSDKGSYIVWGGHRRYLQDFLSVFLYNKEYTQQARRSK